MTEGLATRVDGLMDGLCDDLRRLTRIPSVNFPGYPDEPVKAAYDLVVELLRDAGVQDVKALTLPDTAPVVTGHIPPPTPDAPTVLLYAHYDVQPSGDEALWTTEPFEPTDRDGAVHGRGAADDKSNLIAHIGAIRAFDGRPPVGVRVVFEGQEEYGSGFDDYPAEHADEFACDAMVVGDMGNIRPGAGTLTVALRGVVELVVEARTLDVAKHSGNFGGAAPDALIALMHALATLHDDAGDVAVPGLLREEWDGSGWTEAEFRTLAGVRDDLPLIGTGGLGARLWSGPAITVIGLDAPSVDRAASAVVPSARAKLNVRVHLRQDPVEAERIVIEFLEAAKPFGIPLTVRRAGEPGAGFAAATGGPAYQAAHEALRAAWGDDPVHAAAGGSIPLVNSLAAAQPHAEILLMGAQDSLCNLHGPNERVLVSELRGAVLAEAEFFRAYAERFARAR
ncbi:M20/M25/M40 family metallo-hydrolase [Yinghuangia seranimata]|uniref:M20/M25/M40 family metallo-hydrolase n=1 Tax=Yinghuangia seranimata TaxID=408067 RepID=UPI00248CF1B7|nr:M20/M25/M40 family metallo-hydrolase [Yinghuangia seranimata]MDI2124527.1 M20/M25/M40 family metallo-hydrolase [Yinghuangia seranimata]